MPARAAWKGFLRINQLSVPVKAFTACRTDAEIPLNQIHRGCHQQIRQQRICPDHGVLNADEIISGYEIAGREFLPLEPAELNALKPVDTKSIAVDCFVSSGKIDPIHHSGRTYYLAPDEPPGQRPFGVLRDGMQRTDRHGVARVVMAGREHLVLLRPLGRLVAMTVLEYPQRVRPAEDYEGEVASVSAGPAEEALVQQLIESMTDPDLDLAKYRDGHVDRLNELIQQRLASAQPMQAAERTPEVHDDAALIAMLRASLAAAGSDPVPPRAVAENFGRSDDEADAVRKLA